MSTKFTEQGRDPRDAKVESLRLPPHSIEAEQAVLGGLLLSHAAWERVADVITEHDFYRLDHRIVWRAIASLIEQNKPADVLTVGEALRGTNELTDVGGIGFLHSLSTNNTPANIAYYAGIVRERAILRGLAEVGTAIADQAYAPRGDAAAVLEDAESRILAIGEKRTRGAVAFRSMSSMLSEVMTKIDDLHRNPNAVTGHATGFMDLDEMTTGLQDGDLIVVAGRPSMGKTSVVMNFAEHVALEEKKAVLVFSMEMSGAQLGTRLLASVGRVDSQKLRTGKLDQGDWSRLGTALSTLNDAPILIDESAALTPLELRARARRKHRELGGLGLIVIDYLQLMAGSGDSRDENRAQEISTITRSLKAMARELSCPVIALSQLNRALENRPNKRPMMSDLRESGAIESDADLILFVYRDEVYNENSADKGLAELIIGKQRNGPLGTVRLTFLKHLTRFENYAGAPPSSEPRTPRRPPARSFTDKD